MAPPGACLQSLSQESEEIQETSPGRSRQRPGNEQNEDVCFPFYFCRLHGWLLCQVVSPTFLASPQQGSAPSCSPQCNNTAWRAAAGPIWLKCVPNWDCQPCIEMHGQCPPSLWGPLSCKQQRTSGWDKQRLAIQCKRTLTFSIKDRQQGEGTHHQNNQHPLSTWVEAVPPVTTALGTGGRRRANMDGEFCTQMCVELERGQENSSLPNHQHTNLLHGSEKVCYPTTSTPIFFMAPSSCAYCAFTTTFEALEGPFFPRETVLQYPRCKCTNDKALLVPE